MANAKHAKLAALRSKVNKSYNAHVSSAGTHREWRRISTGIMAVDYAYGITSEGIGGPVVGVIHGLVGWESSGKTSTALRIVAGWQKCCARCHRPATNVHEEQVLDEKGSPWLDENGNPAYILGGECDCLAKGLWKGPNEPAYKGKAAEKKAQKEEFQALMTGLAANSYEPMVVAYFDVEKTLDTLWAKKLGVFVRCIEVIEPGYAEQCIDLVDEYIRSGAIDLVIVDSIPAMVPMTEIEESSEDWQRGLQARLINKAVRKWVGSASQAATADDDPKLVTQVWIQQWRNSMQQFSGNVMPGGHGQKFAFATLMDFRISDREIDDKFGKKMDLGDKDAIKATFAARMHIKAKKNKTATDRSASYRMSFMDEDEVTAGDIFDVEYVFKMAMSLGIVERSGTKYTFRGREFTSQSAIQSIMATKPKVKMWTQQEIFKILYEEYGP